SSYGGPAPGFARAGAPRPALRSPRPRGPARRNRRGGGAELIPLVPFLACGGDGPHPRAPLIPDAGAFTRPFARKWRGETTGAWRPRTVPPLHFARNEEGQGVRPRPYSPPAVVTAPREAEVTSAAYLAKTPLV